MKPSSPSTPFFESKPIMSLYLPHLLVLALKQSCCLSGKKKITQRQSLCGYFNPTVTFSWPSSRQCLLVFIGRIKELSRREGFSDYPRYFVRSYLHFQLSCFSSPPHCHGSQFTLLSRAGGLFSSHQQGLCSQYLSNQQMKWTSAHFKVQRRM